jgi:hypothetical protein
VFQPLIDKGFQVEFHSHAEAILSADFPDAVTELESVLRDMTIPIEEIVGSGGGETKGTQRLRRALASRGWQKVNFVIEKTINGVRKESQSHEVDHVRNFEKGVVALEIEWNNKDPFFDRDLENFKRLHTEGGISLGVIVTRGASLQSDVRDPVKRFADQKRLATSDDLTGIGLNPTPRQKKTVADRVQRGVMFTGAWAIAPSWLTNMGPRRPIGAN